MRQRRRGARGNKDVIRRTARGMDRAARRRLRVKARVREGAERGARGRRGAAPTREPKAAGWVRERAARRGAARAGSAGGRREGRRSAGTRRAERVPGSAAGRRPGDMPRAAPWTCGLSHDADRPVPRARARHLGQPGARRVPEHAAHEHAVARPRHDRPQPRPPGCRVAPPLSADLVARRKDARRHRRERLLGEEVAPGVGGGALRERAAQIALDGVAHDRHAVAAGGGERLLHLLRPGIEHHRQQHERDHNTGHDRLHGAAHRQHPAPEQGHVPRLERRRRAVGGCDAGPRVGRAQHEEDVGFVSDVAGGAVAVRRVELQQPLLHHAQPPHVPSDGVCLCSRAGRAGRPDDVWQRLEGRGASQPRARRPEVPPERRQGGPHGGQGCGAGEAGDARELARQNWQRGVGYQPGAGRGAAGIERSLQPLRILDERPRELVLIKAPRVGEPRLQGRAPGRRHEPHARRRRLARE
ncbi:MAG: hypothetical protein J3K34DRAFT_409601 [Monoraphidium minutum]|nr:MAG: hypothetical protein J3K34DRAFT_409601 [Monoraphidium minutum]